MALSLIPTMVASIVTPDVSMQPNLALQAHHTAHPPLSSPQLLTALAYGASPLPPTHPQHPSPSSGGQSSRLTGSQRLSYLLPRVVLMQQLLHPHSSPCTTQHITSPSPVHQQYQTPTCIPPHIHPYMGMSATMPRHQKA